MRFPGAPDHALFPHHAVHHQTSPRVLEANILDLICPVQLSPGSPQTLSLSSSKKLHQISLDSCPVHLDDLCVDSLLWSSQCHDISTERRVSSSIPTPAKRCNLRANISFLVSWEALLGGPSPVRRRGRIGVSRQWRNLNMIISCE